MTVALEKPLSVQQEEITDAIIASGKHYERALWWLAHECGRGANGVGMALMATKEVPDEHA